MGWRAINTCIGILKMSLTSIGGISEMLPIDYGGCGEVHLGLNEAGELRAVKVYDDLSVNKPILAKMSQRLRIDGWPDGVMPVYSEQFGVRPLHQVMQFVGDQNPDGSWSARNLQNQIDQFPRDDAWDIVRGMAFSLSQMHIRHVAHGNLKPGNVFLDEQGKVLVSDWCLGNMPDVHVFHFTDALLYQPPEQLLQPSGYLNEEAYGWDVFAFGVLSYRLLTGKFPRCHENFMEVVPVQGSNRSDGVKADPELMASNLLASQVAEWPNKPKDELEERMREWIDKCLLIDPAKRPASIREVHAAFGLIKKEVEEEHEHRRLLKLRKRADQRSQALLGAWLLTIAIAVVLAGLWRFSEHRLAKEKKQINMDRLSMAEAVEQAQNAEIAANSLAAEATSKLNHERQTHQQKMEASRLMGDRLFTWALEEGRRRLPPIDGREWRLNQLEEYYQDFLKQSEGNNALKEERARALLHLAEISISREEIQDAETRMKEALNVWGDQIGASMRLRVATDMLIIALMQESRAPEKAKESFKVSRNALSKVSKAEVNPDRLDQLMAVLEYHEAKLMLADGDEVQALTQLLKATQTLNRLSADRPDAVILRSELSDCYMASAGILEGIGQLGDAREVRLLAVQQLETMLKKAPDDLTLQFDLASCYGSMAEAAMLSGDIESVKTRSKEALEILRGYMEKRPTDLNASALVAAQQNLQAGIYRDEGAADAAIKTYQKSLKFLEGAHSKNPKHAMTAYHLALTQWQLGKMLGLQEKPEQELEMLKSALALLDSLEERIKSTGPRLEQWMRSRAYLAGDLAHALQSAKLNAEARKTFALAVDNWKALVELRPNSEEYLAGLGWCEQRLERIPKK